MLLKRSKLLSYICISLTSRDVFVPNAGRQKYFRKLKAEAADWKIWITAPIKVTGISYYCSSFALNYLQYNFRYDHGANLYPTNFKDPLICMLLVVGFSCITYLWYRFEYKVSSQ